MPTRISRGATRRAVRASTRNTLKPARYEPSYGKPNRYSPFHAAELAARGARRNYRKMHRALAGQALKAAEAELRAAA